MKADTGVVQKHLRVFPLLRLHHVDHFLVREELLLALVHGVAGKDAGHARDHLHHA